MRTLPLALFAAAFALAGCSDILPKPAPPPALYRLTAAAIFRRWRVVAEATADRYPDGRRGARQHAHRLEPQRDDARLFRRLGVDRSAAGTAADAAAGKLPERASPGRARRWREERRAWRCGPAHQSAPFRSAIRRLGAAAMAYRAECRSGFRRRSQSDRERASSRGRSAAAENDMSAIVDSADQAWRGVAAQIVGWAADTLARRPSTVAR